jgi:hypothetical protein
VVVALAAAAVFACRPEPGLGAVAVSRRNLIHAIDLSTCSERTRRAARLRFSPRLLSPDGRSTARIVFRRNGRRGSQTIVVRNRRTGLDRPVLTVRESYMRAPAGMPGPLGLVGWSPDSRRLLFYLDPQGSASLAADGLTVQTVSSRGGPVRTVARMLVHSDYLTWCGRRLVLTAGGDRIATTNKRLAVATAPDWRARTLVHARGRAWGAVTCAPDGRSVVVQSQPDRNDGYFFHTHWALWRVGLDGSLTRLTSPPKGYADESPRFSRDGKTIMFVRSLHGVGRLYALRNGKLTGPLVSLGYSLGYYGHQDWWQSMTWSLAAR